MIKFIDWQLKSSTDTDGVTWHYAEFYFEDQEGTLIGSSPHYARGSDDLPCLFEDAIKVAARLRLGESWEEVGGLFRQSW